MYIMSVFGLKEIIKSVLSQTCAGGFTRNTKQMRGPARQLCQLEIPPYTPPSDDFNELSRFLRLSTIPGYSNSDTVSQYNDSHNMDVWNNIKGEEKQMFKMKRDWLSEFLSILIVYM